MYFDGGYLEVIILYCHVLNSIFIHRHCISVLVSIHLYFLVIGLEKELRGLGGQST